MKSCQSQCLDILTLSWVTRTIVRTIFLPVLICQYPKASCPGGSVTPAWDIMPLRLQKSPSPEFQPMLSLQGLANSPIGVSWCLLCVGPCFACWLCFGFCPSIGLQTIAPQRVPDCQENHERYVVGLGFPICDRKTVHLLWEFRL